MSEKTGRRDYLKYLGTVGGLGVGAAAGFYGGFQYGQATAPKPEEREPKELVFWAPTWDQPYYEPLLEIYKAIHPEVEIRTDWLVWVGMEDKLLVGSQSEDPPDIIPTLIDWAYAYYKKDLLTCIEEEFDLSEIGAPDRFYPAAWEAEALIGTGKAYCIPYRMDAFIWWANGDMVKEAGVEVKQFYNWTEFRELVKAMNTSEHYGVHFDWGDPVRAAEHAEEFMWANKGGFFNEDVTEVTINSPESLEAFEYYTGFFRDGYMSESALTDVDVQMREFFAAEKAALILDGLYMPSIVAGMGFDIKKLVPINPPWPDKYFEEDKRTKNTRTGGFSFAIPKKARNKEAAWEFIKWMLGPVQQVYYERSLPTLKEVETHYRFLRGAYEPYFLQAMEWGSAPSMVAEKIECFDIVSNAVHEVALGKTPKQALDDAAEEISKATGLPIAT